MHKRIGRRRPNDHTADAWTEYRLDAACLHPDCNNRCHITFDRRGPKPKFCSNFCRDDYRRERQILTRERSILIAAIDALPRPGCRDVVPLRQQLAHLDWLLLRFPSLSYAALIDDLPAPSREQTGKLFT